jgi:hypothetical protein
VQPSLFDPEPDPEPKPAGDGWVDMRVLITVKAAPTPSGTYGETVCVAGIRQDIGQESWVRLYPINFRAQEAVDRFRKYEIVRLRAKPARNDRRMESWRPDLSSIRRGESIPVGRRHEFIDRHIRHSMCELLTDIRSAPVTFFVVPAMGLLVAGSGMTYAPSRTHDPGGGVTGSGAPPDR